MNEQEKQIKEKYEEIVKKQDALFNAFEELNTLQKEAKRTVMGSPLLGFYYNSKPISEDEAASHFATLGEPSRLVEALADSILSSEKMRYLYNEVTHALASRLYGAKEEEKKKAGKKKTNGKKTIAS